MQNTVWFDTAGSVEPLSYRCINSPLNQYPSSVTEVLDLLRAADSAVQCHVPLSKQCTISSDLEAFSIEAEEEQNRIDHIPEYVTDITCCTDLPFHFRFEFPLATAIVHSRLSSTPKTSCYHPEKQQIMHILMCLDSGRTVMVGLYNVLKPVPQPPSGTRTRIEGGLWNPKLDAVFLVAQTMSMRSIGRGGGPGGRNSPLGGVWGGAPGASNSLHI